MTHHHDGPPGDEFHSDGLDRSIIEAMRAEIPAPATGYWDRIDRTLAGIADESVVRGDPLHDGAVNSRVDADITDEVVRLTDMEPNDTTTQPFGSRLLARAAILLVLVGLTTAAVAAIVVAGDDDTVDPAQSGEVVADDKSSSTVTDPTAETTSSSTGTSTTEPTSTTEGAPSEPESASSLKEVPEPINELPTDAQLLVNQIKGRVLNSADFDGWDNLAGSVVPSTDPNLVVDVYARGGEMIFLSAIRTPALNGGDSVFVVTDAIATAAPAPGQYIALPGDCSKGSEDLTLVFGVAAGDDPHYNPMVLRIDIEETGKLSQSSEVDLLTCWTGNPD